ncbi:MAG: hypothetical protein ACTSR8_14835 [Promethearchaeota archaeon]
MIIFITVLVITAILTVFFILLTVKYRTYLISLVQRREDAEKEKSLDELLDKYVVEEEKDVMKEKLAKISEIIKETEIEIESTVKQKIEVAEAQIKAKGKELDIITKARDDYVSFTANFRPAMPETEEERIEDMDNLKEAISMLESFDAESYAVGPKKVDAGLGMFYDKMSRRFQSIISEHKMDDDKFIPIQKLKYHAFQEIRNLKNNDILPIVNIMRDTGLLNDIIEINSTLQLIVLSDKKYKFTNPEKVLMTFAFDEDYLTLQKLMDKTEWKEQYAERIIKGLVKKGVATYLDENIKVDGFGHAEERKKWREIIEDYIKKEKEKDEEKRRRQKERKLQLRKQLARVEKAKARVQNQKVEEISNEDSIDALDAIAPVDDKPPKIKFENKIAVKSLPTPKEELKIAPKKGVPKKKITKKKSEEAKKKKGDIPDGIDGLGALTTTDDKQTLKVEPELPLDFNLSMDDEERDLEDLVPEKILEFHEKFSLINGGLVQYEKIKKYVESALGEDVPDDLMQGMLNQLKELQMVHSSTKIGKNEFFLFNEINLSIQDKNLIRVAIGVPPITKEFLMKKFPWDEKKTTDIIQGLQKRGILKYENDKIIIPGAIQEGIE